jgi:hypothetical protein
MRKFLIPLATFGGIALVALPVAAQHRQAAPHHEEDTLRGGAEMLRQSGPTVERSADSALGLDIGPLLDALHPYGRQGRHLTLRELGRSNDPDFDQKLHRSIYRGTARAAATLDAMATAAPSIRQSLHQMENAIAGAMDEARRPLPREAYEAPPARGYDAAPQSQPPADDDDDDGSPW